MSEYTRSDDDYYVTNGSGPNVDKNIFAITSTSKNTGEMDQVQENGKLDRTLSITSYDSRLYVPLKCGYGKFSPSALQVLHNAKCLLVTLCLCAITQGMLINGLIPVSITSLEKRFRLSSTQSGIYASMYDIAVLIALVPVCHYGGKGHKGKWLGAGMFIMGLGSLICALPQFLTGPYQYGQSQNDTCQADLIKFPNNGHMLSTTPMSELSASACDAKRASDGAENMFYVLLLGQLLNGFGAAPLYTLGVTYIDENVSQRSSPLYLGIYFAFSVVGPAAGFVLGGMFLRIFGDIGKVDQKRHDVTPLLKDSVTIDPNDPAWYGAWWIGMILTGVMSILFSFPLLGFAKELPEARRHRKRDINQTNAKQAAKAELAFGDNLKSLPRNCWELLKNRTYSCLILMKCAEAFLMNGMVTFIPKLIENLFTISSSTASLLTGAVVVPGGFLGSVIGGYLIKRFKLRCAAIILLACACQIVSLFLILSLLIYCPEAKFVGVNVFESRESNGIINSCNSNCQCPNYYKPVCHDLSGHVYFSPCHAGCTGLPITNSINKQEWSNCACINETRPVEIQTDKVAQGLCQVGCSLTPVFLVVFGFQVLVTFTSSMPIQQAELRCVPFKQRTLAVSLSWVFVRLLGSIPGAILFGMAIDGSCALWQTECGEQKSCIRYTSRKMALSIMSFGLSFKVAIIIFLLLAWKFYKAPKDEIIDKKISIVANGSVLPKIDHHQKTSKVFPTDENVTIIRL